MAIEGDFCPVDFNCPPASIQFTASAPDITPPQAPSTISFDVYDYPNFRSSGGDCRSDSDLGFWVTVDGTPAAAGEAPVIYSVKAYHRTETTFEEFGTSTLVSRETTRLEFHQLVSVLHNDPAAEALCFRVTAIDSAGNASTEPIEACEPCHVRADIDTGMPYPSTSEPEWLSRRRR